MILGIGVDLVDINRIERSMTRFGARFLDRVFTEAEQSYCHSMAKPAAAFAKRYAAKEAAVKAIGTGIAEGVCWLDFEVTRTLSGAPGLVVSGVARDRAVALTPIGYVPHFHLSLTDEFPYAQAFVTLSAVFMTQN